MLYVALFSLLIPTLVFGAPSPYQRGGQPQDEFSFKQELSRLWNDLGNHDADIQKLQNHIATQDDALEEMRDKIDNQKQKAPSSSLEQEVASLRKHNEILTQAINGDKEAIARLQTSVQKQENNLAHMQKALESIMNALGIKSDSPKSSQGNSYTVKGGDSLGEIAQKNHTTLEELKKLNQLNNDRIFVGQKIKLP